MSNIGFVYILTNEYMPDVYKVGCTERSPHARAEELSKATGVPSPFKVLCYIECEDFQEVERSMHQWLGHHRISPNREFFHEGLDYAVRLFWWYRKRLAFCEPGTAGSVPMLSKNGELSFLYYGGVENLAQSTDPWAPPQEDHPFAEAAAAVIAEASRTPCGKEGGLDA